VASEEMLSTAARSTKRLASSGAAISELEKGFPGGRWSIKTRLWHRRRGPNGVWLADCEAVFGDRRACGCCWR
jgi:hypothetical protein